MIEQDNDKFLFYGFVGSDGNLQKMTVFYESKILGMLLPVGNGSHRALTPNGVFIQDEKGAKTFSDVAESSSALYRISVLKSLLPKN